MSITHPAPPGDPRPEPDLPHARAHVCPICGQALAEGSAREALERLREREREQSASIESRLRRAFEAETSSAREGRRGAEAELARLRTSAAEREAESRADAAAGQERIAAAESAMDEAEARAAAAELQARTSGEDRDAELAGRLREQRDLLEAAMAEAVNRERSAAFAGRLSLSSKMGDLQRMLDGRTVEELGESAELDLFEALKAEFHEDRIERVGRGRPGADIVHTVIRNGREVGRIIYDSKNHTTWRESFVSKLRADQMEAGAAHAILSTRKFPAGERHLHVCGDVLVAAPARVVALVTVVRQHLVQIHGLRMSNEARSRKTDELYAFVTSDRCDDLLSRLDAPAEDLLELQSRERRAHETTWRRQAELLRSLRKARAELRGAIDSIIGTAPPEAGAPPEPANDAAPLQPT